MSTTSRRSCQHTRLFICAFFFFCLCVYMCVCVQGQLAAPRPCPPAGGGSLRPACRSAWLNPGYGPSRRTEKKKRRESEEEEKERKEEMEGDLWAFLAKGLPPFHKPIGLDYKTLFLFKRALFFHSWVVGATVGG